MLHQVHEGTHNICDGNGCNKGQKRWYETRSGQQLLRLRNHFFSWWWCDSHWFSWCPVKSAHLVSQHVPTSTRNVSPGPGCFFSFLPCEHRHKQKSKSVMLQCQCESVLCSVPLTLSPASRLHFPSPPATFPTQKLTSAYPNHIGRPLTSSQNMPKSKTLAAVLVAFLGRRTSIIETFKWAILRNDTNCDWFASEAATLLHLAAVGTRAMTTQILTEMQQRLPSRQWW